MSYLNKYSKLQSMMKDTVNQYHLHILDFVMFHQILLLPQVKRYAIITYKHGIY